MIKTKSSQIRPGFGLEVYYGPVKELQPIPIIIVSITFSHHTDKDSTGHDGHIYKQ